MHLPTRYRPGPLAIAWLLLSLLAAGTALAQTGYDVPWHTVDGGGGESTGGTFALAGTIGQPDAGSATGGSFTLRGGYHAGTLAGTAPGDCNGDAKIDAADISALVLELFDGDGSSAGNAGGGTYAGDPVGCDANQDALIDAADISCVVLLIFGDTCGA